jgi:uroporphyrinogen decarboxylase
LKTSILATGALGLAGTHGLLHAVNNTQSATPPPHNHNGKINKREKVLAVLDQSKPNDYIPAGFFLHFNDKLGDAAVKSHVDFFHATNMDFVKIQYEIVLPKLDDVKTPKDWKKIPVYDKTFFQPQLQVIQALVKELKAEALVIPTVYSPFSLAQQTAGEHVLQHANENPDDVAVGFQHITESIVNYLQAATDLGVDGFYISTQGGDVNNFADTPLYDKLIKPFDLIVSDTAQKIANVNILHICDYGSSYNQIDKFVSYPGSIINPPIKLADNTPVFTKDVQKLFKRPVMGGLDRLGNLATGNIDTVLKEVDEVLTDAAPNIILAADCTVPSDVPWDKLRQVIDYAHNWRNK